MDTAADRNVLALIHTIGTTVHIRRPLTHVHVEWVETNEVFESLQCSHRRSQR